jgi:putative ABC transport system ATP-binding protein
VLALLRELCRERQVAVVFVSHDPLAAGYADRVLALRDGQLSGYEPDTGRAAAGAG